MPVSVQEESELADSIGETLLREQSPSLIGVHQTHTGQPVSELEGSGSRYTYP